MNQKRNIVLMTEYDGTSYSGWQSQRSTPSVQEKIRSAILQLTGEEVVLHGCSRTDAGVHALGHVSHFSSATRIPIQRLPIALNSVLAPDISVLKAAYAPEGFHARFSATGKQYRYRIHHHSSRSALERDRAFHVSLPLDISAMREAAVFFIGEHDFSGFMSRKSTVKTTHRRITGIDLQTRINGLDIIICGNSFLTHMVRIICGTLVNVGLGKTLPEEICDIIRSKDRTKAGKTLPGHGLYLEKVFYPIDPFHEENRQPEGRHQDV